MSRIEVQSYSHSHARALAVTVDAAINSGNSGGPVLSQTTGGGGWSGWRSRGTRGRPWKTKGTWFPRPSSTGFLRGWEADKDAARKEPRLPSLGVHLQLLNSRVCASTSRCGTSTRA